MKHITQLRQFETEYNTKIWEDLDGIWWEYNSTIYGIETKALGYYKRYKLDMYRVCKQLTFNSRVFGKRLKSAIHMRKFFKKQDLKKAGKQ